LKKGEFVLQNSFRFIPGIGPIIEKNLWRDGIFSWDELTSSYNGRIKSSQISFLNKAKDALIIRDVDFFAKHLPQKDYWRLYKEFNNDIVFLDIETTGLSQYYDDITLIGVFDGKSPDFFVKDNNIKDFPDYIKQFKIIVTFNGSLFDLPFIKKYFPNIDLPSVHIDLRFLLRSIGISGPLKNIEQQVNFSRPDDLTGVGGREAVILWHNYLKGDNGALEKLLLYNAYDTMNLQKLLNLCYQEKINAIRKDMDSEGYQLNFWGTSKKPDLQLEAPEIRNHQISIRANNDNLFDIITDDKSSSLELKREVIQKKEIKINTLLRKLRTKGFKELVVGIDLTGSESRASGVCTLNKREAYLERLNTDEEIIASIIKSQPTIVSIDSPLSLPKGRDCTKDSCVCRKFGITRECERTLKKRGINSYPCLIKSMQGLTERGMRLTKVIEAKGFRVIESYPGAAQDVLGLPRKKVDLRGLEVDLMNMGIKPRCEREIISHDEIDALTSALVGYFYLADEFEALGNEDEGYLIIPKISTNRR
jgi:uncharacterized protein YprB with RNaseH-like and TPR domain/predicted nuclease with RNAse H fold